MFIVFPPVDALPPAVPRPLPSNFTLAPQPPAFTGRPFPAPGALGSGSPPVQPNQWLLGAFQPQSMETVLFTPAGPYPLPPVPIVPIPPPPVVGDVLGVTGGNALGLVNGTNNLGVLT
jgi:hypothetical protein